MLISFFGGFEERAGHVQRPAPPMPMPTPGARAPAAKHTDTTGFSFFFWGGGGLLRLSLTSLLLAMQQQGSGESEPDIDDPRLAGIPKAMRRMFLAQLADQMKQESRQPVCMCTCMWIHVCMRAVTAAAAAAAF